MGFLPSMTWTTDGIRSTAPARWRAYQAMCGIFWEAEGKAGATGFYKSPDPRVMLFFNDVSSQIGRSDSGVVDDLRHRPLARAVYVPAGTPMWTRFYADHSFSHLDLHLKQSWLVERLTPALGASAVATLLRQPREVQDLASLAHIGEALKHEISVADRHPVIAESLAVALVAALVEPPQDGLQDRASGGLTPAQMKRLTRLVEAKPSRRHQNADLAGAVGLSPSWFSQAFKKTTGRSPLQWQQERRIEAVKRTLLTEKIAIADLSDRFGFADQAHFTRVFRQVTGTTPAAWLRENRTP